MNSPFTPSAAPPDLFSAVIEQAPDAIIFADREGAIRLWNARAEARAAHWQGYRQAIATGQLRASQR